MTEIIVRCRDCKHWDTEDCPMVFREEYYDEDDGYDYWFNNNAEEDGFCHRGEKWEDEYE